MSIGQKLHLADGRVPDERLGEVWHAVYEGYSERWSDDDVQRSIDVGEEVCSALEELVEARAELEKPLMQELKRLRATLARVEALPAKWRDISAGGWLSHCADELDAALTREA